MVMKLILDVVKDLCYLYEWPMVARKVKSEILERQAVERYQRLTVNDASTQHKTHTKQSPNYCDVRNV